MSVAAHKHSCPIVLLNWVSLKFALVPKKFSVVRLAGYFCQLRLQLLPVKRKKYVYVDM